MVNIIEVKKKKDRKRFIDFQNTLYKGVEQYVPTMMMDELTALDRSFITSFADRTYPMAMIISKVITICTALSMTSSK